VAGRASACAIEILFAGLDVSGLEIRRVYALASTTSLASTRKRLFLLRVDKRHQARNLLIGAVEGWHALIGAPTAHDRTDLVSVYIRSHQLRSREIGTALSAASIAAMTKGTILPKKSASSPHQFWRVCLGRCRAALFDFASSL
jgi:hypothetical protein